MAFKIKDNLDLYGNQLLNFALQSDSGFPQSPQVGHMFNYTGTGVMANHAVMCVDETTKAFKALAFVDEIATNTAFTELAERVTDLETALGTDEKDVLDTWEEVKTFLASIKESDGDLMTMLNSKLNKSGGTIGDRENQIPLSLNGTLDNMAVALQLNGTTKGYLNCNKTWGTCLVDGVNTNFRLGITPNGTPYYSNTSGFSEIHTLIHSGNIGEYAPLRKTRQSTIDLNAASNGFYEIGYSGQTITNAPSDYDSAGALLIDARDSNGYAKLQLLGVDNRLYYRMEQSGNATITSKWKTIAFTDSDITGNAGSATKLETKRTIWGQEFDGTGDVSGNLYLGTGGDFEIGTVYSSSDTNLYNKIVIGARSTGIKYYSGGWTSDNVIAHDFKVGISPTSAMIVNNSGNVTIGGSDLAGTSAKLYVDGAVMARGINADLGGEAFYWGTKGQYAIGSNKDFDFYLWTTVSADFRLGTSATERMRINANGNVLIGTPTELKSGAKLQIKGDLYVDGNIIATKEVSAGGAGQEGASGDGGAEVIDKELAKGQSSYTIPNTIGRSAVAVSLYEANVINGQTIWSLCLADIEVTNTTITVTFGSATSVNHKLVAVG